MDGAAGGHGESSHGASVNVFKVHRRLPPSEIEVALSQMELGRDLEIFQISS